MMSNQTRVLCTGAGGFIGTHLVERLKKDGHWVRAVDLKRPQWSDSPADEFRFLDLRFAHNAVEAMQDIDIVYHLAADMGGMARITGAPYEIIRNNTLINANTIDAARATGVERFLFSSSACVYPVYRQEEEGLPLKEDDAYPAQPQESYGWEKLHMEHLCREYREADILNAKIVRFHNCYGPRGEWAGGREKAPAALCRKVAISKLTGNPRVEIWGDGGQVRSFMYVDDCVEGLTRLMNSSYPGPLNLGRDRTVTINEMVDMIADVADTEIEKVYVEGPQGVRWRNSDNTFCNEVLEWVPSVPLEVGIKKTYHWIEVQVRKVLNSGGVL